MSSYVVNSPMILNHLMIQHCVSTAAGSAFVIGSVLANVAPTAALPPPEDVPEEILRTEIILDARSPLDGEPISADEYAELQAYLEDGAGTTPTVSSDLQHLITLLRLRRFIRIFVPVFP